MCGAWPDINIFRVGLKKKLAQHEMVVADKGYRGELGCCTPYDAKNAYHRTFRRCLPAPSRFSERET